MIGLQLQAVVCRLVLHRLEIANPAMWRLLSECCIETRITCAGAGAVVIERPVNAENASSFSTVATPAIMDDTWDQDMMWQVLAVKAASN